MDLIFKMFAGLHSLSSNNISNMYSLEPNKTGPWQIHLAALCFQTFQEFWSSGTQMELQQGESTIWMFLTQKQHFPSIFFESFSTIPDIPRISTNT